MSRVDQPDPAWPTQPLAALLRALGRPSFGAALLATVAPAMRASHATAFRFDADLGARVLLTASAGESAVATRSARVYEGAGLHRHDRLRETLAHGAPQAVLRMRRADIANVAYRERLWDRFDLVDRVLALVLHDGGRHALNLYRGRAAGEFGAAALRWFDATAPVLLALLAQHLARLALAAVPSGRPSPEAMASLLDSVAVTLSARERQVYAMTLAGHARQGIALSLGMAQSSVATLRARAYRKLGIGSAGELFALCLQQAAAAAAGPAR